jgi:hypothetical protein
MTIRDAIGKGIVLPAELAKDKTLKKVRGGDGE